jgi:3-methyladenine DNA glycosylase/8-oxoguanine DNA glycosylase
MAARAQCEYEVGLQRLACRGSHLGVLVRRFAGLRPPRFPAGFEMVVNAICSQQLGLEIELELLNRLSSRTGP